MFYFILIVSFILIAHDKWGLVCDDEFELKDGDVVCRHLGYPLGAAEIKKHSFFTTNHKMSFIIDNLHCLGNETSIADCFHNGWGVHDCQAEEVRIYFRLHSIYSFVNHKLIPIDQK